MNLSYRTRRNLRRAGKTALILAVIGTLIWLCWMIWIARFVLYDRDLGAQLNFDLGPIPEGILAEPPAYGNDFDIIYKEPDYDLPAVETEKTSISGYYIDFEDLKEDIPGVLEQLKKLKPGTAVLFDVKSTRGYFYYSSDIGDSGNPPAVDVAQMDALIEYLVGSDLHLIARLPAFRDWRYGLNNVDTGLPYRGGGGALWMDDTGCYWLNPTNEQALNYLVRITGELQTMGFDEVVYEDFRFPNTDRIVFNGDKAQAIADAAASLVTACASETFCVSFVAADAGFTLPQGNCRVYLSNVAAENVDTVAQQITATNPQLHVLFMTDTYDTRYDKYCVLRPLDTAH